MKRKTSFHALCSAVFAAGLIVPSSLSSVDAKPGKDKEVSKRGIEVQLLGTNDFHGQIDVYREIGGQKAGGAEYLAAYLEEREAENKNTLIVHAGDAVGASSPTSALLQDEPTIEILNEIGFDVGTLGNHEFDEGIEEMNRLINGGYHETTGDFAGADFPYISANVVDKKTGETVLPPYVIKKVNGMPIGFIGVTTQETANIVLPEAIEDVEFIDETEAINQTVADLKEQKVEAIVVLAHNPAASGNDGSGATGETVELANAVNDEVDIIFGGHNHAYANTVIDDKLLVQSYSYGTAFSDVDMVIDPKTKDIVEKSAEIVTTYHNQMEPDPVIETMVNEYESDVAPLIQEEIGTAAESITADPDESGESPLGNLIADSQRARMETDFAFMNPGGIRADLNEGSITWGELYTIQPFGNTLTKMTMTGEQIKTVLEQQFSAEGNTILQVSGIHFTWDESAAVGEKIVEVTDTEGNRLMNEQEYTITVNNFLASGGDGFTGFLEGTNETPGPVDLEAMVNYIVEEEGPVNAPVTDRIDVTGAG